MADTLQCGSQLRASMLKVHLERCGASADMDRTTRFVALKIMMAKACSSTSTELAIYAQLKQSAQAKPWSEHVNMLLDSFEYIGPNGTHSTASVIDEIPSNKPKLLGRTSRCPKTVAKKILKHSLTGLAFLHENGVIHGDLQPGNLLFKTRYL
jgi:serine/threonine protein kinase